MTKTPAQVALHKYTMIACLIVLDGIAAISATADTQSRKSGDATDGSAESNKKSKHMARVAILIEDGRVRAISNRVHFRVQP